MEEIDDLYHIKLIKDGKADNFVHLVRKYNRMVFTIISKIVTRREVAEDITQEVFIKVFQSLDKFREESVFSTWLYRVAYNTAISELRKIETKKTIINIYENVPDSDWDDNTDNISTEKQLEYLEQILATMPKEDALLITLFYLNQHTIKEVCSITGYTESNAKVKLHRIRRYIYQEMSNLMKDE